MPKLASTLTLTLVVLLARTSVGEPTVILTGQCTFGQSGPGVYSISSGPFGYEDDSLCIWAFEGALITIDLEWMGTQPDFDYLDMWRSDIPGVVDHDSVCGGPYTGEDGTYCVRFTGIGEASWTGARLTACQATIFYFYSDGSYTDGGFSATVTVNDTSTCTGMYHGTAGVTLSSWILDSSDSGGSHDDGGTGLYNIVIILIVVLPIMAIISCFCTCGPLYYAYKTNQLNPQQRRSAMGAGRPNTQVQCCGKDILAPAPTVHHVVSPPSQSFSHSASSSVSSTSETSISVSHGSSSDDDDGERPTPTRSGKYKPPPPPQRRERDRFYV